MKNEALANIAKVHTTPLSTIVRRIADVAETIVRQSFIAKRPGGEMKTFA